MELSGKQKRYLRSLGHQLAPVVQIGKLGLTPSVTSAIADAIEQHELVKVRIGTECPDDRLDVAERVAPSVSAALVQVLGRTLLLYKRRKNKPVIVLPREP